MGKFKKVLSGIVAFVMVFSVVFTCGTPLVAKADGYDTGIPEIRSVTVEPIGADENGNLTTASSIKVTVNAWDDVQVEDINLNLCATSEDRTASRYISGAFYHKSYETNEGWTVDEADNYSYTFSLGEADYNGYVFVSYISVKDASGNSTVYGGLKTEFRLLGNNPVTSDTSPVADTFDIISAAAYDSNGNPYKNGDVISENTVVTYKVTTAENLPVDKLDLYLRTNSVGTDASKTVSLTREPGTNTYAGSFTYTSDMYPTGWKASNMSYSYNQDGVWKNSYYTFNDDSVVQIPTVILKVGSQVVYPTINLSVYAYNYDFSRGYVVCSPETVVNAQPIPRYSKLVDYVSLPEAPAIIDGVQTKWHVYSSVYNNTSKTWDMKYLGLADDFVLDNDSYSAQSLSIVAMPEGYYPVKVNYAKNEEGYLSKQIALEWIKASSEEEVLELVKAKYQDSLKNVFQDAEFYSYSVDTTPGLVSVSFKTSKIVVQYQGLYVRDYNGKAQLTYENFGTKEYTTSTIPSKTEMLTFAVGHGAPKYSANGIKFQEWKSYNEDEINDLWEPENGGLYNVTVAYATYDKDVVCSQFYDNEYKLLDTSFDYYTKGTTDEQIEADIKSRAVGGYTNWNLDCSYTEDGIRYCEFITNGDKADDSVTPPSDNIETEVPSSPTTNDTTSTDTPSATKIDVITSADGKVHVNSNIAFDKSATKTEDGVTSLTSEAISRAVDMVKATIEKAKETTGDVATSKVTVGMADATVVPTEILEAAKGQDVDVEFVMTGDDGKEYSWTVNGSSITGTDLKNVNLKVNKGTSNVPASIIGDSAATGMPNIQLNLADHGLFGFTANLRTYVGTEYSGKYANLFYYTNGRLEIQTSCLVDAEGYTTLSFTHASDYVVAMGDDLTKTQEDTTIGSDASQTPVASQTTNASQTVNASVTPKTGDEINTMMYVIILMVGVAIVAGTIVYRKKRA